MLVVWCPGVVYEVREQNRMMTELPETLPLALPVVCGG